MRPSLKARNILLHAEKWVRLSNQRCPDNISLFGAYEAISFLVTHLREMGPYRRNHRSDCKHCKSIQEATDAMYEKADFEEKVVAYAVKNLTKRQIEILALMKTGKDLVCEGRSTYIGNNRTSVRTVLRLLQACAITIEDRSMIGKFERYSINETGREILRRKGV